MLSGNIWSKSSLIIIFSVCLSLEIGFVLLDLFVNWFKWSDTGAIRRLFNITREDGIASLFAIIQTFAVAVTAWVIYFVSLRIWPHRTAANISWLVVAVFFTYMTIDDGAMVHERIGTAFKQAQDEVSLPSYGWQIILAPFFVLMGCFLVVFLWRHSPVSIRRDWLLYGVACMGTAVLIDFIEGTSTGYQFLSQTIGLASKTTSHFAKSFEEFLEMLGMTLFFILFVNHLMFLTHKIEIRISRGRIELYPTE